MNPKQFFVGRTIGLIIVVVLGLAYYLFFFVTRSDKQPILNFADCLKAGLPIMESYPRQCKTPDGRNFVEELTNKITYFNSSADLIMVELPFPGAVVGKDFSVIGQARGTWFFEASFPIEVLASDGKILATGIAQAQGEWMTENFVAFKADIKIPETYIGEATLVLKKDNPSGLAEHEASISFPIVIEY